tara:strand:+ start:7960 stop:10569 length:2610 start_codon:yes stop_codon:yes gene_type:complete
MNSLVIVESGAKATKIKGYLDSNFKDQSWQVEACLGHIRDLPDEESAVNPENWSDLKWKETQKGKKTIKALRKICKEIDTLYLATDPDREGEAIAWHLHSDFKEKNLLDNVDVKRITFTEITSSAIKAAIENPRKIDQDLVDAYLTRRILDHLIGFKVSPLLWRHISRAKSAGRVQSPTLRIICEKEDQRDAHVAKELWPVKATFTFEECKFDADLISVDDRDLIKDPLNSEEEVNLVMNELAESSFLLADVETKPQSSSPKPPFRTSTLQMAASSTLGFTADRTMNAAQKLYEGGFITYLRTDGISISTSPNTGDPFSEENPGPPPLHEIRNLISSKFGQTYLSEKVRVYKAKVQNSQEAHEAIRPTDISKGPDQISLSGDEERLYILIWNRTVASQMVNSKYERKILLIESSNKKFSFKASSRKNIFLGFETLTKEGEETEFQFPDNLVKGINLELASKDAEQKFTTPPNRFSEASLIKRMEEEGIGRPSTYATIVKALRTKKYAYGTKSIVPSDLGRILTSYLKNIFEEFFIETKFTARMETDLDEIASGNKSWQSVLDKFWDDLQQYLNKKINDIEISNQDEFKTRQVLDLLNEELHDVIFPKTKDGSILRECPKCSEEISLKSGAWGYFVGCAKCKWTKKPFDFKTNWETYQELPKDLGIHPDLNETIFADMTINGPCVWTMKEEKKIFGTPDEDEFILDIGLNRAIELIERSNAENVLFTEINSGLPIILKNGRFGEYTEYDGFNKATKLKPEDKEPSPKVSYYEPNTIDYESESGRRYVLNSLRIIGFVHYKNGTVKPIGIKIRKPGKAFKFVKNLKIGDKETEVPSDWYKLEKDQQSFIINETLQLKDGDWFNYLEDCKLI